MSLKTVKTHVLLTRDAAVRVANDLRNECKPCSDPYAYYSKILGLAGYKFYKVDQYVTTSYPEI
jgi:hypothetical protein